MDIVEMLERARSTLNRVEPEDFRAEVDSGAVVIDMREIQNRDGEGHLPSATVVGPLVLEWRLCPTSEWRSFDLEADQRVILVCNEGYSSSLAASRLQELGLNNATDLVGGYRALSEADRLYAGPMHA